ncbi:hypothetical protein ACH5RR_012954 [Cinchona calisaya]|uniref:Uncharacterized protein n=1 Tax=Cinchona calisaya TaxID=153742 RepID=A0ABD3A2C0_9GENT
MDKRGKFNRWRENILEARIRTEGEKHIALTANNLWQLWKGRNSSQFEQSNRDFKQILHQAWEEWHEYKNRNECESNRIFYPGILGKRKPKLREKMDNMITLSTAIKIHDGNKKTGYGILAHKQYDNSLAAWALVENKTGNKIIEEVEAVKLAF